MEPNDDFLPPPLPAAEKRFLAAALIFFAAALAIMLAAALWPPSDFPTGETVHVAAGASLGQVADDLYQAGAIKSVALFKASVLFFSGERGIKAGDYLFARRELLPVVAWRLVRGDEGLVPIKVTIPEGFTVAQTADALGKAIPGFSTTTFASLALPSQGYLFPDTYFFNVSTTPAAAVSAMRALFGAKISAESSAIAASGRATSSVVIMASILEREATSSADRRLIAGILWKRLDAGQALDVDATLAYALDKNGAKLTLADLATTSPYNTYKYAGLPPAPISDPGLETIQDALAPTASGYWYYLSDSNGDIHYAATYDQQLANEAKYL